MSDDNEIDPSEVTIADILTSAAERQIGTVTAQARHDDGSVQWACIVIRGEGADEMLEAITDAMNRVSEKWESELVAKKSQEFDGN